MFTTPISHFSSVTIPTYSTCTCPYSIPMSILCASMQESYSPCQIWTMDTPFDAQLYYKCISCNQNKFILFVAAFEFSFSVESAFYSGRIVMPLVFSFFRFISLRIITQLRFMFLFQECLASDSVAAMERNALHMWCCRPHTHASCHIQQR